MKPYVCLLPLLFWHSAAAQTTLAGRYRIETVAGNPRSGDGGTAVTAQIGNIQGVAADRAGNIYLSDTDNHRVRRVSAAGVITTVAGTGTPGFAGDGGPAAQAQLNLPYGLAVDGTGNLYIADLGNNRVRRVSLTGAISTVATLTPLLTPRNVAVDAAGNLYISEFDGNRVRRIGTDGSDTVAAGTGTAGFTGDGFSPLIAQLSHPAGLAIDRGGALLIADSGNNRIRRLFANGTIGTVLGGSSGTTLLSPTAVAVDIGGIIYAGDTTTIVRTLTLNGKWSDAAGGALAGYTGDGGPAVRATLTSVHDLATDAGGSLLIADGVRVRRVDLGGIIQTTAGDGYLHAIGDGGPAVEALLVRSSAVTMDSAGVLSIADTGTARVRQVQAATISTLAGGLSGPMGVAADAAGNVYIADTAGNVVRQVGVDKRVRTVVGTGAAGMGAPGSAPLLMALRAPRGVCVSRSGVLFVVDTANHRVLRIGVTAQAIEGPWSAPEACSLDVFGNLYVADTGNHRVRKVSFSGVVTTVAGTGDPASDGDEGPAISARLDTPRGVAVDDAGNIFIAEAGANRIRLVTADGVIHRIAGKGAAGFAGDGGPAADALLNSPAGLLLDPAGAVYFADSGNHRVRRLVLDGSLPPAGITLAPLVAVVNALSGRGGAIAPGELVSITGSGFGPDPANLEVRFNGIAAPLFVVQAGQITAQVPYEAGNSATTHVEVRVSGAVAGAADLEVALAAPGLFRLLFNGDGGVNGSAYPAAKASTIALLATGEGLRDSGARPLLPLRVTVGGLDAEVLSIEPVAGWIRIFVRVPGGFLASGPTAVELWAGTARSGEISVVLR